MSADIILSSLVVVALVLVIAWQTVAFHRERGRLVRHNDELLNRLMSRDFAEYAAGSRALPANWRSIEQYMAKREKTDGKDEDPEAGRDDGLGIPVV